MDKRLTWIIEGIVFVLLIVATIWGWQMLSNFREEVLQGASTLEMRPEEQVLFASVQSEISRRGDDVASVESLIVERNQLGDVVGQIEGAAQDAGVLVALPEVEEKAVFNEHGNEVEPSGPIQEVRIAIVATGSPRDLLEFLYQLEHLPYLVTLDDWRLDTQKKVAQNQFVNAPSERFEEGETPQASAVLDVNMAVNVFTGSSE